MREATYGVSARVIASFFVLSIALVFFVSANFGSFKFFTGSKSEFKVPIVELQTKLTSASDEFQARSTTTNSFRNRTVIVSIHSLPLFGFIRYYREKNGGLEHGLARARALIRTAAALSPNMPLTLPDGDGDVLTSDIYRNYGDFFHLKILPGPTSPEIHLYAGDISPKLLSPWSPNPLRPYLAFFAGGLHGPIRPILLNHWKNRNTDLPIYEYLPKGIDYFSFILQSKYCLCPSGHEVASPRIVEAIYAECVPVILSDHYVLPFSDVLRWEGFSVQVETQKIPQLKEVLMGISEEKYMRLKEGVRAVRRHFVWNQPDKRLSPLVGPPATTTATAATTSSFSLTALSLFSYSLHRSSPVVSTLVVGFKTLTLPLIFSNPSTSHMFESRPYTPLNCFRTFVYKGLPPDSLEL
ncbi:hypothetical protein HYC85_022632 [Camellia sinensis]|uniref:Exostosin GT47 domain-containing protein n=1 Tax=Camellia sinensis TaxID=4442 RepID=A0A7J7GC67_CAMSI|nr:hypothetical protein HYC85_022632 [Camellia sinensis]